MTGDAGAHRRWQEDWADLPQDDHARHGWAHHGLAVTGTGALVAFHPGEACLLIFNPDGTVARSIPCPVREAHGLTLVEENGVEYLWISDIGSKQTRQSDGSYRTDVERPAGQVLKVSLDGAIAQRLETPPLEVYQTAPYAPTSVAVLEVRHGGSGDIWVADGYGRSLVHRFAADGTYLDTLTGEDGVASRFSCPHCVFVDRRKSEPELYIADRGNARVQVYGPDGHYRRTFGEHFLNSPSAFATIGDTLVIAELFARLALLDRNDQLIDYLGANPTAQERPGWPNALAPDGSTTQPRLQTGRLNSPHGLATDAAGAIYISEWVIGGRLIRLD
jgi:hypothetical protein